MLFDRVKKPIRKKVAAFEASGMGYWRVRAMLTDGRIFDNVYINNLYELGFPEVTPFRAGDIVDVEWGGPRGGNSSGVPVLIRSRAD
jgi:hypothetical protein